MATTRTVIIVNTYNRPAECAELLRQLDEEGKTSKLSVRVYDDASTADYSTVQAICRRTECWHYIRLGHRHGRELYWKLHHFIMHDLRSIDFDYCIYLPDDITLCPRFIKRALHLWGQIADPKKIALNLLRDAGRDEGRCWTKQLPVDRGPVMLRGWIDMMFLCERRLFEVLGWRMLDTNRSRWIANPLAGSGVGQQLSTRLYEKGWGLYQAKESLVWHLDGPSKMNPTARLRDRIIPVGFAGESDDDEKITASLASIPSRADALRAVIASLLPQVDQLNVYLNSYASIPDFLTDPKVTVAQSKDYGDLGDAGKFFWAAATHGYHFTCDDDLIYPPWHVELLVREIEKRKRAAVIGLHGVLLKQDEFVSYYKSREVFPCLRDFEQSRQVHILGTGALAYHASTVRVSRLDFRHPNMADVWFGLLCQRQKVPLVCVEHRANWLRQIEGTDEGSIYLTCKRRMPGNTADLQTGAILATLPWELHRIAPCTRAGDSGSVGDVKDATPVALPPDANRIAPIGPDSLCQGTAQVEINDSPTTQVEALLDH